MLRGSTHYHANAHGVLPDGHCAYIAPGGYPSNYEPGPSLLIFRDRADTDELAPYSVWPLGIPQCHHATPTVIKQDQ